MMDTLVFQPAVHPAITVGLMAALLMLAEHCHHRGILLGLPLPFDIIVVAAPGNPKDLTHNAIYVKTGKSV